MDLAALSKDERERLAGDPGTDPSVLAALADDFFLLGTLAQNPSTPEDTRRAIYRDFPHLRPADPDAGPPMSEADAAIEAYRRRQQERASASTRRPASASASPAPAEPYIQAVDPQGRTVYVPVTSLGSRGTNGLAIASFVLALVGGSVLAVILGHMAKTQIAQTGEGGDGLATAGLVIGYLSLAVLALLFIGGLIFF